MVIKTTTIIAKATKIMPSTSTSSVKSKHNNKNIRDNKHKREKITIITRMRMIGSSSIKGKQHHQQQLPRQHNIAIY